MNVVVFNFKSFLKLLQECWLMISVALAVILFGVMAKRDNLSGVYVYASDVSGTVETLQTTGSSGMYSNEFMLRLDNGDIISVNTPASFGITIGDELTVKLFVDSKNSNSQKYQYIPPKYTEEDCFAPCEPIRVGR